MQLKTDDQASTGSITTWLHRKYRPAQSEGPAAKWVKFEAIQTELAACFPSVATDPKKVAKSIVEAFPESVSRVAGISRQKHIFGIEEIPEQPSSAAESIASDLRLQLEREREEKRQLQCKIHDLEPTLAHTKHTISQSLLSNEVDAPVDP